MPPKKRKTGNTCGEELSGTKQLKFDASIQFKGDLGSVKLDEEQTESMNTVVISPGVSVGHQGFGIDEQVEENFTDILDDVNFDFDVAGQEDPVAVELNHDNDIELESCSLYIRTLEQYELEISADDGQVENRNTLDSDTDSYASDDLGNLDDVVDGDYAEQVEDVCADYLHAFNCADDHSCNVPPRAERRELAKQLYRIGKKLRKYLKIQVGLRAKEGVEIVEPGNYLLGIDKKTRETLWSLEVIRKPVPRRWEKPCFRMDYHNHPAENKGMLKDRWNAYLNSSWDRGHFAAAANHCNSFMQLWSTFVYSNTAPTLPHVNQHVIGLLESFARGLAFDGEVFVLTGGVRSNDSDYLVCKQRRITHFYKAILVPLEGGKFASYAWYFPHEKIKSSQLHEYVCTLNELQEHVETIDIFPSVDRQLIVQASKEDMMRHPFFKWIIADKVQKHFVAKQVEDEGDYDSMLKAIALEKSKLCCCVCKSPNTKRWTKEEVPRRICEADRQYAVAQKAGVRQVEEWRATVFNRDRSHPDLFCCVCRTNEPGKKSRGKVTWYWTNEENPRRICMADLDYASRNAIYLDAAGVKHVEKWRALNKKKDRTHSELLCCVCKSEDSGKKNSRGKMVWEWTNEKTPRRICRIHSGRAYKNRIYMDERGIQYLIDWHADGGATRKASGPKTCCICGADDHGVTEGRKFWPHTLEENWQRICDEHFKLARELNIFLDDGGVKELRRHWKNGRSFS